jgi:hypothetical protein
MFEIVGAFLLTAVIGGSFYYLYYTNQYNDEVTELLTLVHENVKCIKYQYRGRKYIYLTYDMAADISTIQKEIDPSNPEKDKLPISDYKNITARFLDENNECVYQFDIIESKFIYALMGPANTYYFAFDKDFNDKFTVFMNFIFNENSSIHYGRFSALLTPNNYFDHKVIITNKQKEKTYKVEWCLS